MKTIIAPPSVPSPCVDARPGCSLQLVGALALASGLLGVPFNAPAQTDDFNDGNDDGWTQYDPLGGLGAGPKAAFSFTNGGYRIRALTSPQPNPYGPGRAASLRQDTNYSRFHITVDIVGWNDSLNQAFGLLARIESPALGMTTGYSFTYQNRSHEVQMSSITAEDPADVGPTASVTLSPTNRYRFVFSGNGSSLQGSVYLVSDLTTPLAVVTGNNSSYLSGAAGLLVYDNASGGTGTGDATFDNYSATDRLPPKLTYALTQFNEIIVRWPEDYSDFRLESAPSLSSPIVWTDLGHGIPVDNQLRQYDEGAAFDNKLFRLVKP